MNLTTNVTKVAVAQMTSSSNISRNVSQIRNMTLFAAKNKAQMIFFPENAHFMGTSRDASLSIAESLHGTAIECYRDMAKTNNIWISIGGFQEKCPENESKIYNTHVLIDNLGEIQSHYRKIHLFDYHVLKESELTKGGKDIVVTRTPAGILGLSVCYDVRFPLLYHTQRSAGAEVLSIPAAFTYPTGLAHWKILLQARAIENQCYVIAAAQTGYHNKEEIESINSKLSNTQKKVPIRRSFGHSMIIDPWGKVLAEIPYTDDATCNTLEENIQFAEIDSNRLHEIRSQMPIVQHEKPAVYQKQPIDGALSV